MSSSPSLVIVGGYAPVDEPGIYLFHFDEASGGLTAHGSYTGITNPSFLVHHPRQPWLYAVAETSEHGDGLPGAVWALRFAAASSTLHPINHQLSGGDHPCHLQMDRAGRWLLVSNYSGGSVAVLPILADGALGERTDLVQHEGHSVRPDRQEKAHAHSARFSPDEQFVLVADLGLDEVRLYAFDSQAGQLTPHSHVATRPGAGPRHMTFHPRGRTLYVANELNNTVTVYGYDAAAGQLQERQTLDTLPPDVPDNIVADIHLDASGQRLYVSNRGHNSLSVFNVEPDEQLAPLAVASCGGNWPRHFSLTPRGRGLLVANQYSHQVSVLPLLAGPEAIGPLMAQVTVPRPSCVISQPEK